MRPLNFEATFTTRLPIETRELVAAAAEREGASASAWVRRALRAAAEGALGAETAARTRGSAPLSAAQAA